MTSATPKPRAGEHTKGPWHIENHFVVRSQANVVATMLGSMHIDEANARRIVACVNACEGIPTASLELGDTKQWIKEEIALRAERDQLKEQVAELNIVRKYAHDLAVSLAALREQMEACKAAHMSNCLDADKLRTQVGSFREALEDIRDELQQANGGKGPSFPLSMHVLGITNAALVKHGR